MMLTFISNPRDKELEVTAAALMYVLSPIVIVTQLAVFLYPAWLIGLLPLLVYYFIRYQKYGRIKDVVICTLWSFPFALAFFSIPWLLGFLLPAGAGFIVAIAVHRKISLRFIKRSLFFISVLIAAQAFWLIPFVASFNGGYAGSTVSGETGDTFSPTVLATAHGNIFYPLIGLYHRQIAFDFNWDLKHTYLTYYDKMVWFDLILAIILITGIVVGRRYFKGKDRLSHLAVLVAFVVAVFLFTVNIGAFKDVFLLFGKVVPGFAMFRNFSDKFALGYVFIYSVLFAFSLIAITKNVSVRQRRIVLSAVTVLILLNAAPIRSIIVKPLWTTKSTQTVTKLPSEYMQFMGTVKTAVPSSTNILSIPFGASSYTIIKDPNANSVYAGRSPVQLFSGVNDLSGTYSFPTEQASYVNSLIKNRDYNRLRVFMWANNINYVIATKNIPSDVLSSYLFDGSILKTEDKQLSDAITAQKVATSSQGNYILYRAKSAGSLINVSDSLVSVSDATPPKTTTTQQLQLISDDVGQGQTLVPRSLSASSSSIVYPLDFDKGISLAAGNYTLRSNHSRTGTLFYDTAKGGLVVGSGIAYQLGNTSHQQNQNIITKVGPTALVAMSHDITQAQEIRDEAVNDGDAMTLYESPGKNILPAPTQILRQWHGGDCRNYEPGVVATWEKVTNAELSLSAVRSHNACVYSKVPVVSQRGYLLSFDYQTTASKLDLNYGGKSLPISKDGANLGAWKHFEYAFASSTTGDQDIYFYSGADKNIATTNYKNFSLIPYATSRPLSLTVPEVNTIPLFVPGENTLKLSPTVSDDSSRLSDLAEWGQGDCSAVDTSRYPTDFHFDQDTGGVTLHAKAGHNACLYKSLDIDPDKAYLIEFDYRSQASQELDMAVSASDNPETTNYKLTNDTKGGWQHFRQSIVLPHTASSLHFYLYSGTSVYAAATTSYKNISLKTYPLNYQDAYVVQSRNLNTVAVPAKVQFSHQTAILNIVTVHGAAKPFMLSFAESFQPGWKLYIRPWSSSQACSGAKSGPVSTAAVVSSHAGEVMGCGSLPLSRMKSGVSLEKHARQIFESSHVQLNGSNNGWMIDPDYVKAHFSKDYYHVNPDGSIDMNLAVYFQPQVYFFIGSIISGITLVSCLVMLPILRWRHLKKRRRDPSKYRLRAY